MTTKRIQGMSYDELGALYKEHYGEDRPTTRFHPSRTHDDDGNIRQLWFYPIWNYYVMTIDEKPVAWRGYKVELWFYTSTDSTTIMHVGDTYTVPEYRNKGCLTEVRQYHRKILVFPEIMGTMNTDEWYLKSLVNDGFQINPQPKAYGCYWEFAKYYTDNRDGLWAIRPTDR